MSDTLLDKDVKYAGFGMRMLASTIDSIVSAIILMPVAKILYIYGGGKLQKTLEANPLDIENMPKEQLSDFLSYQILSFSVQNIAMAIMVILFWVYRSATPGKMILKMNIVDEKTGEKPTNTQFITRYLGYFISFLPLCLGFIWIFYDKKHQGWHDKLAGTVVVINK